MISPMILRLLPYVAALAGVVAISWWLRSSGYEKGVRETSAAYEVRLAKAAEQGRQAVDETKKEAERQNENRRQEEAKRQQDARDEHQRAINLAHKSSDEWQSKYRSAVSSDPSCTKWSQELVRCPL